MRRFALTLLAIGLLVSSPAFAQDRAALCRAMRADDVNSVSGAAYQPGVDARGRPVAPADAGDGMDLTHDVYYVPLTIDLARQMRVPVGTEMQTNLGVLAVRRDGSVSYNGRDLTTQSQSVCGIDAGGGRADTVPAASIASPSAPKIPAVAAPQAPSMGGQGGKASADNDYMKLLTQPGGMLGGNGDHAVNTQDEDKPSTKQDVIFGQGN